MEKLLKNLKLKRAISILLALCMIMSVAGATEPPKNTKNNTNVTQPMIKSGSESYYYYILEATTGAKSGDAVMLFKVDYTDADNVKRTEYIFPHIDGRARSLKWISSAQSNLSKTPEPIHCCPEV